jgi:hypothetical protein
MSIEFQRTTRRHDYETLSIMRLPVEFSADVTSGRPAK